MIQALPHSLNDQGNFPRPLILSSPLFKTDKISQTLQNARRTKGYNVEIACLHKATADKISVSLPVPVRISVHAILHAGNKPHP